VLALALGGRTVSEWQACMTRVEFLAWADFYELYPFDDLHRFHRPAAMTAAAMGGASIAERLEWLQPPPPLPGNFSDVDQSVLKAFRIRPPTKE
jgi:hypothetical protein